jgi:selenocysteine lyase/cysteine desulfurase
MYAIINAKMTYLDYAATSPLLPEVREAMRQAEEAMNKGMESLTGGLNIPGLGF